MKQSSMLSTKKLMYSLSLLLLLASCKKEKAQENEALFSLLSEKQTNIDFVNHVIENTYFNFLNYPYVYNGGGVAVGDINNDGLEDIYFTSNQNSNKLYLNEGKLSFKDITDSAHVIDDKGWTTGVTMVDINNDGWLDIYVCKAGALESHELRKNKLYVNQKDNTFKESAAEYGLDFYGFSIQSYFFDMDNDGDLDMYLVNHRIDFRNNVTLDLERDQKIEDYGSDQLFRNDNGQFTNVTDTAGVANKAWGLSASIGDFNNDGWLDVFVANDFFHSDYLYINNKNGTFTDQALNRFKHISNNSMGSDFADLNNDLQPDLVVLDMLAEDHIRGKNNMASMNTNSFNMMVNSGYHHQYMSNVLQLNNSDGTYSEISQLAGIAKTDWSWAPLIADFDNDGFKDVFVTNGIKNDLSNQDFRDQMRENIVARKKVSIEEAIAMMPSEKLQNYLYKNNGDLTFKNASTEWGISQKINSNGCAYSDLDNDGDLDLIVNNQSEIASIYKNNSTNNHVSFSLKGNDQNPNGIGASVTIYTPNKIQNKSAFVSRGYQSSVTNKIHFGLGDEVQIDSVKVLWQNGNEQVLKQNKVNNFTIIDYKNAQGKSIKKRNDNSLFVTVNPEKIGVNYIQKENNFNDFDLQLLLPQKQSEMSSPIVVGDVNNDDLEDFFVGNAKDAKAALYVQLDNGTFVETSKVLFENEKKYEDTDAVFFDVDNDNDLDLYVTSGGYEIESDSPLLQDRIYINDGAGNFIKGNNLPSIRINSKGIATADYDDDGDIDVFIGSRVKHGKYPLSDASYLLENQNGKFIDVTSKVINEVDELGMINDAIFSDYDNDGDKDLIMVGEWMPITIFENQNKKFIKKEVEALTNSNGWYQSIKEVDLDNDGNNDYILGNWGGNNKFHPTIEKPLHIYAGNFDENESFDTALSKVSKTGELIPVRGKECSSEQTPYLNDKLKSYKEFASSTLFEIYGSEKLTNATHYKAHSFKSVVLKNNGNSDFEIQSLPIQAQFGPTLGVEVFDINNDGYLDIFGVGNVYDAEVETIRYDASKGYVLLGNNEGSYEFAPDTSYINNNEAKTLKKIVIGSAVHFIILNKNNSLKILKTNSKLGPVPIN